MESSFHGPPPREKVIAGYVLMNFSDFSNLIAVDRIKTLQLFELFGYCVITEQQFRIIGAKFYPQISEAIEILIKSMRCPLTAFRRHEMTKIHQTVLMLVSHGTLWWEPVCQFLGKTSNQCLERKRYVIKCLEKSGLFDSNLESHSRQRTFSIAPQEALDISPPAKYDSAILKAQMMRIQRKNKTEILKMRMQAVRLSRHVQKLQRIVDQQNAISDPDSDDECEPVQEVKATSSCLLHELTHCNQLPGEARRYSDQLLSISQLLALTSRKAYLILRQVLPLPSLSCLKYHFATKLAVMREKLTSLGMVREHILKLLDNNSSKTNPPLVTLAIDAFAFQSFYDMSPLRSKGTGLTYSNAFVFMCLPLDTNARPAVIHLMIRENGNFDSQVMDRFREILEMYKAHNVNVLFSATDGDRFLSAHHDSFFKNHVEEYQADFSFLIGNIYSTLLETKEPMPISDPLHFSKNLRGRIIDHNVAVVATDELEFTNTALLKSVLGPGPVLEDVSRLGRMRDFYVTSLFTLNNVCKLMKSGHYHSAFLFLPYGCIFAILYSKNLRPKTRLFLANLSYTCFSSLMEEAENLVMRFKNVNYRHTKSSEAVVFSEPSFIRRMMHTCLALGISINYGPKITRLDAVGTHLVENTIGIARTVSNSSQFNKIVSAFANSEMRKSLAQDLELQIYVSRRINDGGTKIEVNSKEGIKHPSEWDPRDIVSRFREVCRPDFRDASMKGMEKFQREFCDFVSKIEVRKMSPPSPVSNCAIMERNIHFCKPKD